MKKDLLTLLDLDKDELEHLLKRAARLKKRYEGGIRDTMMTGRSMGLIFDKKSTRTRIAFETAMIQLGGHPIYMSTQDTHISRNEPVRDTARVLSRYIDCLVMRTFDHKIVEAFARHCAVPVINALTDGYHPCQILGDIMTVIEKKRKLEGLKIVWVGDGNNVANSWINAAAVLGFELTAACPEGFGIRPEILAAAAEKGDVGSIGFSSDPVAAVKEADVVYTDVWASMGEEAELASRIKAFEGFQVNKSLLSHAAPDVTVMHCLPAHRGEEISEEVFEAEGAVFWDQAENKRHMHKAILEYLMIPKT